MKCRERRRAPDSRQHHACRAGVARGEDEGEGQALERIRRSASGRWRSWQQLLLLLTAGCRVAECILSAIATLGPAGADPIELGCCHPRHTAVCRCHGE